MLKWFHGPALLLLTVGCGPQISSSVFVTAPPKSPDHEILVFLTRTPECPYEELGTIKASEGAFAGGVSTYMPAIKKRARELGGDALVAYKTASTTTGYVAVAPSVVAAAEGEIHSAVVVRFTKPDCTR
jgi:hypothetical protein